MSRSASGNTPLGLSLITLKYFTSTKYIALYNEDKNRIYPIYLF